MHGPLACLQQDSKATKLKMAAEHLRIFQFKELAVFSFCTDEASLGPPGLLLCPRGGGEAEGLGAELPSQRGQPALPGDTTSPGLLRALLSKNKMENQWEKKMVLHRFFPTKLLLCRQGSHQLPCGYPLPAQQQSTHVPDPKPGCVGQTSCPKAVEVPGQRPRPRPEPTLGCTTGGCNQEANSDVRPLPCQVSAVPGRALAVPTPTWHPVHLRGSRMLFL